MSTRKSINVVKNILLYVMITSLLCIIAIPLLYTFFGSFKTTKEILTGNGGLLPQSFRFDNYVEAWKLADFATYTWNSVYYSIIIVIGNIITSTMGGYVFARAHFKGKKAVFAILTATMFVSLGSIGIYPTLNIAKFLHINKSLLGVIIINIFGVHITNVYIVRGFVESLPKELDEAAKIDGCGFFGIFVRIIFPLLKPAIATIAIMGFRNAWNDYLLPMVFTMANPKNATLPVGLVALKGQSDAATAWNLILAGAVISILPIVIVYVSFNKYFMNGVAAGAVKG